MKVEDSEPDVRAAFSPSELPVRRPGSVKAGRDGIGAFAGWTRCPGCRPRAGPAGRQASKSIDVQPHIGTDTCGNKELLTARGLLDPQCEALDRFDLPGETAAKIERGNAERMLNL